MGNPDLWMKLFTD